jgi:hypothetical protein
VQGNPVPGWILVWDFFLSSLVGYPNIGESEWKVYYRLLLSITISFIFTFNFTIAEKWVLSRKHNLGYNNCRLPTVSNTFLQGSSGHYLLHLNLINNNTMYFKPKCLASSETPSTMQYLKELPLKLRQKVAKRNRINTNIFCLLPSGLIASELDLFCVWNLY